MFDIPRTSAAECTEFRIGVVGFSRPEFDQTHATQLLLFAVQTCLDRFHTPLDQVVMVSGLTNVGMPRIAYLYATEHGIGTVGIAAERALLHPSGLWPVDLQIIEGLDFGDESRCFTSYIDCLIRIGGGTQSRREVEMFCDRCRGERWSLAERLIEHDLPIALP
ncbi:hypothetical protein [Uliginosibacterium sp. TH139]|uniref:hypothetical protein n=1 Tax=Uliginosibacterium sp. TH139 TaxID=2067453 RepID=UPI000C7DE080|nr:hypothetical protein [Uliginosibacterium sp. TH139]PLK50647.1 hypothetical protein C0V76_02205 [Uliginosibacterium sp. TH139]